MARTFTTSNVATKCATARSEVQSTHSRESIFTISLFIQARYARRSHSPFPSPPLSLPHLLHTQSTHIVNCILYLVSVSLLSVKCKVNTRYFTQICQVFAQRVWARHIEGEERRGWAGLFGVAQSAAQCNGIYCNLHFNAQMSFLYALNVN